MSALIDHRVSAVNSREGNISRWGGREVFGVRLCACQADENWQLLACVLPKDCLRGLLDQAYGFAQGPSGMVGVLGLVS